MLRSLNARAVSQALKTARTLVCLSLAVDRVPNLKIICAVRVLLVLMIPDLKNELKPSSEVPDDPEKCSMTKKSPVVSGRLVPIPSWYDRCGSCSECGDRPNSSENDSYDPEFINQEFNPIYNNYEMYNDPVDTLSGVTLARCAGLRSALTHDLTTVSRG